MTESMVMGDHVGVIALVLGLWFFYDRKQKKAVLNRHLSSISLVAL